MMTQAVTGMTAGCTDGAGIFSGERWGGEPEVFSSIMASVAGGGSSRPGWDTGEGRWKKSLSAEGSKNENDPDLSTALHPFPGDCADSSGLFGGMLHPPGEAVEIHFCGGQPGDKVLDKVEGREQGAGGSNPPQGALPKGERFGRTDGNAGFSEAKGEGEGVHGNKARGEGMIPASTRDASLMEGKEGQGVGVKDHAETRGFQESSRKSGDQEAGLLTKPAATESASGSSVAESGKGGVLFGNPRQDQQPLPVSSESMAPAGSGPGINVPVHAAGNAENTEQHFQGGQEFKEGSENLRGAERISADKPAGESSGSNKTPDEDTRTGQTARLVAGALLKGRGASRTMEIQMKPEVLGRLRIELSINGKQADVRMITEGVAAKEAIEQSMAQIRADLQRHGLDLQRCDVHLGGSFGAGVGSDGRARGQSPAGHRDGEVKPDEDQTAVAAPAGEIHTGEGLNRVDYFV